ncbi:MAG: HAD family hydrolase [Raoultibacter sp.]
MQTTPKAILFDLDGTLLDTHDLLLECFRFATRQVLNREIPADVLMAKVGQPLDVQMWDFTDDEATHDALCRAYRARTQERHDACVKSFPGGIAVLQALKAAGYPLGVVTSKRHIPAQHGLQLFDMAQYFDCLVGADDCAAHKPDPEPVRLGAKLLGCNPQECVYVGDSPFDMQAGNGAGCFTIAALWGMFPEEVLRAQTPDAVCAHFEEILEVVRQR